MEDAYGAALKYKPVTLAARMHRLVGLRYMAIGFAIALVSSLVIFGVAWVRLGQSDVVPGYVRSAVNFPIYQPRNLPAGFTVDPNSFKLNSRVVTFMAHRGPSEVLFTEQAIPRQLDFEALYTSQLSDARRMTTTAGNAVVGYFADGELGSVKTERTWILVRAKQGVSSAQMDTIIQGIVD